MSRMSLPPRAQATTLQSSSPARAGRLRLNATTSRPRTLFAPKKKKIQLNVKTHKPQTSVFEASATGFVGIGNWRWCVQECRCVLNERAGDWSRDSRDPSGWCCCCCCWRNTRALTTAVDGVNGLACFHIRERRRVWGHFYESDTRTLKTRTSLSPSLRCCVLLGSKSKGDARCNMDIREGINTNKHRRGRTQVNKYN